MVTTAGPALVTTGTTIKTLLQVLHPSLAMSVVEWGITFDGSPVAIKAELLTTGIINATVTAFVANDVNLFTDPAGNTPGLTLSTAGSGYTASAEGTITATREGDTQVLTQNQYLKQWPLDQEFVVKAADVLRVRVTAGVAVNANCYIVFAIG